jgi:hypothetical protein
MDDLEKITPVECREPKNVDMKYYQKMLDTCPVENLIVPLQLVGAAVGVTILGLFIVYVYSAK